MNDSFTSASIRRETMRSRLFGAVMRRGLREGNSVCGQQRKYTPPRRHQQPATHHIIHSAATTYERPSTRWLFPLERRLVDLLDLLRFARSPLLIFPRDRLAFGAQALVPLARDLTRELAIAEAE